MRPLQISPETAVKLAKQLNVPLEHLMHMPQHILLKKLAELANEPEQTEGADKSEAESSDGSTPSSGKQGT
ncbi:YycC family protein [Paenibacillus turpanensis]|uniref:YycC family protein n=1 Tax=Paenibacillus turpanensis TaxID=2689078 RepID=UPI00140A50DB|nr:YycC family protein [Paenibacillus turpanensis]